MTREEILNLNLGDGVWVLNTMARGYYFTHYEIYIPENNSGAGVKGYQLLKHIRQVRNPYNRSFIYDNHLHHISLELPEGAIGL